jgi:hypothetical protein
MWNYVRRTRRLGVWELAWCLSTGHYEFHLDILAYMNSMFMEYIGQTNINFDMTLIPLSVIH